MAVVNCRICGRRTRAEDLGETDFRCECGNIIPAAERRRQEDHRLLHQKKKRFSTSTWSIFDWNRAIQLVFGGIVCIATGIWLLASPTFRAGPNELTVSDALPGVGAIVAGCGMLTLMVIFNRR
jgi:hypothetical protein